MKGNLGSFTFQWCFDVYHQRPALDKAGLTMRCKTPKNKKRISNLVKKNSNDYSYFFLKKRKLSVFN